MSEIVTHPEFLIGLISIASGAFGAVIYYAISHMYRTSKIEARLDMIEKEQDKMKKDFREALDRMEHKMDKHFHTIITILKKND